MPVGPIVVSAAGDFTPDAPFSAVAAKLLVKQSPGYLIGVLTSSVNAGIRFLQIFNKASEPVAGDVPVMSIPIPGGTAGIPGMLYADVILGESGLYLPTGIALGISTTAATFTIATAADHTLNGTFQ